MKENKESESSARAHAMVLEMALVTLIRMQPDDVKRAFMAVLPKNVEAWQEHALLSTYSDEWIAALKKHSDALLSLVEKSIPHDAQG